MDKNSVKYLQGIDVLQLTLAEKTEIKNLGRTTPNLAISQSSSSRQQTYVRKFTPAIYAKHKWLSGCVERNALFCFPCLLFSGDKTWTETGVTDLKHLSEKVKKHEDSAKHLKNVVDLGLLGAVNISSQLSEAYRQQKNKYNEKVRKNREILSKIIDYIKFCGKFEFPLYGNYDTSHSPNPGVFPELLELAGKLDESLKTHFLNSTVFGGTPRIIQNELLDCILEVCRDEICTEIKQAKFLSVMSDDTSDVSEHAQQVIVFRYETEGAVRERFWGFFNQETQNAEGLAECILEQLSVVLNGDTDKLIAQTYDGAAVISGEKGVQAIIKKSYPYAHFVHCYAHQLNLIMEKVASQNTQARIFFGSLAAVPSFFVKSPLRLAVLDSVSKHICQGSNTRWDFNNQLVNTVYENKETLKECFERLQINRHRAAAQGATGLFRMMNDKDFNFWLTFFHHIMPHVNILHYQLQHPNANSTSIYNAVNEFLEAITTERNKVSSGTHQPGTPPPVKKRKGIIQLENPSPAKIRKETIENLFSAREVCDTISCHAKERFAFTKHLSAAKLFNPSLFNENANHRHFSSTELDETIEAYPFLCKERLTTELFVLYERQEFCSISGLMKMYETMLKTGIGDSCTEVFTLLQIILTTPMTTADPERCFFTLKRVKTFLRNTVSQDRLSALAMLSVEKVMIENIVNFNAKVMDKFANRKERRMDFI